MKYLKPVKVRVVRGQSSGGRYHELMKGAMNMERDALNYMRRKRSKY